MSGSGAYLVGIRVSGSSIARQKVKMIARAQLKLAQVHILQLQRVKVTKKYG